MTPKERELHLVIENVIMKTPITKFKRTLRGVRTNDLEFIFSTDRLVIDDDNILVVGKKENYITSQSLRNKLIHIYEALPQRRSI